MQAGTVLAQDNAQKILEWKTMVGVPQAFTGTAAAPSAASMVAAFRGRSREPRASFELNGHLAIKVDGLVLASTLSNPVPAFRATVSCLTDTAPP